MTKSDGMAATGGAASGAGAGGSGAGAASGGKGGGGGGPSTAAAAGSSGTGGNPAPQQPKATPKDGLVIGAILKDMGITEYEPRVVHQLLEFAYRYVTAVLEEAQVFSIYAKKKNIDAEDVRLAVQLQVDKMFTSPPPRDLVLEIARHKNNQPLPAIKSHAGPRLPPDRYSLIGCNYKLKPASKLRTQQQSQPTPITLPFRSGTSLLNNFNRPGTSVISLQPRSASSSGLIVSGSINSGNRVTITPVADKSKLREDATNPLKRKLDEETS